MNHNMLITGRSSMDDEHVYFVTGYDSNGRPNDVVGVVRVTTPTKP